MTTKTFYIEHMINGDLVEYEYEVEADGYEPYVAAKISGPPEDCYPAEGGCAMAGGVRRRLTTKGAAWEPVAWDLFLAAYVEYNEIEGDPAGKSFRKTALQKAEQQIEDELTEACEEELQGRYEDACEARADFERERDW